MTTYDVTGTTCAWVDQPGVIVLIATGLPLQTLSTDAGFDADAFVRLVNCEVTTTHRLNFRAAPNGIRRSEIVPQNVSFVAFARSGDWFNVIYRGESGWISANYVVTDGICQ